MRSSREDEVMKAPWNAQDYQVVAGTGLAVTVDELGLIRLGLA